MSSGGPRPDRVLGSPPHRDLRRAGLLAELLGPRQHSTVPRRQRRFPSSRVILWIRQAAWSARGCGSPVLRPAGARYLAAGDHFASRYDERRAPAVAG
ncbi:unnamed protein product [Symbiodinium pilosum]|uniref:Uncharacterized protein n=1 Tax=Symbiodinium pilosum TaxID=2952 RepID=A0A812VF51_SYMPI|nr:unnamed protein product [Symbiodinium pilosum]